MVLTFRDDEVDPAARTATTRLPETVSGKHVVLPPLDEEQAGALAAATLGLDTVSAEFAAHLCQRASGLPFVVQELVALLRVRGTLARRGGGWVRKALDELDVPAGVREPVRERVAHLAAPARVVVEAAAVMHTPVPVTALAEVCQLAEGHVLDGCEEAVRSGLLTEVGDTVGFRHVLAAQAVYEDIPGVRRRELHRRAAAVMRVWEPVPLGQVAHHLWHAGQITEWVTVAEVAADQARVLGDAAEAARLLEDVLRHAPLTPDQQGRFAVKLAGAAIFSPRAREMIGLLFEVAQLDLRAVVRGELRLRLAKLVSSTGGDPALCHRLYAEAVADLDDRPDLKIDAMIALGTPRMLGARAEQRTWLHRALEIVPRIDDPVMSVSIRGEAATALVLMGDPAWRRLYDEMRDRAGDPLRRHDVIAAYKVGMEACHAGHYDIADRLLTAGLAAPSTREIKVLELGLRTARVVLDFCRGGWDGLPETVDILHHELSGFALVQLDGESVVGCLSLARGDQTQQRLTDVVQRVERAGHLDLLPLPLSALARLAVVRGEPDAIAGVAGFLAMVESGAVWPSTFRAVPAVTQALVVAGDVTAARQLVARCTAESDGLDAPLAPMALHHARGFLAAATEEWRDAARHFLAAAEQYEPLPAPYEAAQAREQAAVALFALGDAKAEATLRAALATYDRLAARWDLERAGGVARRYGMSLPARHRRGPRGYGAELSPREREVAELAATGRTNREIAAELSLSTNTVNKHLSAALRKLGLRSRTALSHHLASTDQATAE